MIQLKLAPVPWTFWVPSTVLSRVNVKVFELPSAPATPAWTCTVPVTDDPAFGLAIVTAGLTVIVWKGGLGSFTPKLSTAVNEQVKVPADANVTAPGLGTVLVLGVPPGKYQDVVVTVPSESLAVPVKMTDWPALIFTTVVGAVIVPLGGVSVGKGDTWRNFATDGMPVLFSTKSK